MDRSFRRSNAPAWPPNRYSAYQRMSSNDDLSAGLTPSVSTPGTGTSGAYRSLLTPRADSTPYDTPALLLQSTPKPNETPSELKWESEKARKPWFGYGWRGGAKIALLSTVVVLITNVVIMVYMSVSFEYMDGFPVIVRGTCDSVERQNSIWHFVINALSTVLLAASNYAMQLLSAPTRNNIDRAHATGHWLDIGIPSVRNLRYLNWKRRALWFALGVSSIPLHLIYNSTFYAAIATNNYNVLYATPDFVTGAAYDTLQFPDSAAQNISDFQKAAANWTRLDNEACINNYAHDFVTAYRNVITVVNNVSTTGDSSLLEVVINELPPSGKLGLDYDSFAWICNDTLTSNKTGVTLRNEAGFVPCAAQARALADISDTWWRTGGYSIDHCLAEQTKPDCHLHFSPQFMGPVILMNIVKCLVLFYVTFRMTDAPLITTGDAIESFLKHPDPTTTGRCLTSTRDAERTFIRGAGTVPAPIPQNFQGRRHRWATVVSRRQWLTLGSLFVVMIGGIMVGLAFGVRTLAPPTLANAWSIGLGVVQTQNLVLGANMPQLGASAVLITALVANSGQALLSFLYMVYNVVFTSMYLGQDWDMYGAYSGSGILKRNRATHRYLRVSNPRGNQKSTHMLNLPFRYAVPLVCMSGLLHWLMSQSLFLANISIIPRDGTLPRHDEITTIAFAPQALIWLGVVGIVMLIVILGVAMRQYGGEMQIVGSNSAAISAACHSDHLPERLRREMVLRKIAWGEIPSSGDARLPDFSYTLPKRATLAHGQADELTFGLGIKNDGRTKFAADDFVDVQERNVERNGYAVIRGQADEIDSKGHARSTGVGHCGFSDGFVFRPEVGRLYA